MDPEYFRNVNGKDIFRLKQICIYVSNLGQIKKNLYI